MSEYHKIKTLFERDMEGTKKLIEGTFRNNLVKYLRNNEWVFTEKIDGTNIRVCWNGHKVSFKGRTDKAIIPNHLLARLEELFGGETNEQLFEQTFGEKEVVLYGEGYGIKIQNGGLYRSDVDFILFDIRINNMFLSKENCIEIAKTFNIEFVPIILKGTIQQAIDYVKNKPKSKIGTANMEGLVGTPIVDTFDSFGERAIVKIKVCDFELEEK